MRRSSRCIRSAPYGVLQWLSSIHELCQMCLSLGDQASSGSVLFITKDKRKKRESGKKARQKAHKKGQKGQKRSKKGKQGPRADRRGGRQVGPPNAGTIQARPDGSFRQPTRTDAGPPADIPVNCAQEKPQHDYGVLTTAQGCTTLIEPASCLFCMSFSFFFFFPGCWI